MVKSFHYGPTPNSALPTPVSKKPFKQMQELVIPRVVMNDLPAEIGETTTYALGWAQVHLPAALGSLGGNADLVKKTPQTGKGLPEKPAVLYHAGSLVGYLSSIILLPETKSAIIVLVNTLTNQDLVDWIGQAIRSEPRNHEKMEGRSEMI